LHGVVENRVIVRTDALFDVVEIVECSRGRFRRVLACRIQESQVCVPPGELINLFLQGHARKQIGHTVLDGQLGIAIAGLLLSGASYGEKNDRADGDEMTAWKHRIASDPWPQRI